MAEYYKFEIANWNEGTANLSLEQEAAYLRVVNAIRLSDQPITFNMFVLGGLWRCNERKAKRLLDELISLGKLRVEGGRIINDKAVEEASDLNRLRDSKKKAGKSGGIESGKARRATAEAASNDGRSAVEPASSDGRRGVGAASAHGGGDFDEENTTDKSLENNNTGEAPASTREEKRREDQRREEGGGGGGSACVREAEPNQDPQSEPFRVQLLAAMGIGPDGIAGPSKFIGGQGDMAEAQRWLDLPGMTEGAILSEIRALTASKQDGPPKSFRYFTAAMQRLSGQLTAAPLQPTAGQPARASPAHAEDPLAASIARLEQQGRI